MITIPFQIKITNEKILPTFQYQNKDYFLGIRHLLLVESKEYNSSNYIGLFIGKIRNQDFCSKKQIKGNYKVGLDSLELIAEFKKLSYNFDEQLNYDVKVNTNLHFQKVTKLKQEFYRKIEWIGYVKNSVLSKDILDNQKLKYNENEYGFFLRLTMPLASIAGTVAMGTVGGFFGTIGGASLGFSRSSDEDQKRESNINNEILNKIIFDSETKNSDDKSDDNENEKKENINDNPDINKINDNNNNDIQNDSELNKNNESNNNIVSDSNKVINTSDIKEEENKINENNNNKNDNNDEDNSNSEKCFKSTKNEDYIESNQIINKNNNIKDNPELNENNKNNENDKTSFILGIIGGIFGGILGTSLGALSGFAMGTAHQFYVVKDILNLNYNQNNIWKKFATKISQPEYKKLIVDSLKKFVYFKDDKVVGFIKFANNIVPPINGYFFKCNYNIKIKLEINGIILSSKKYLKTKVDLYDSEEYVSTMKKIFKTEI